MDYKLFAIHELQDYQKKKLSIESLQDKIANLKSRYESLKAVTITDPVMGGGSRQEDNMISNIVMRMNLETNLEIVKQEVANIDKGLAALDDDQKLILWKFYIDRPPRYLDQLIETLRYEKTEIYKKKNLAIRDYTISRYGIIDI